MGPPIRLSYYYSLLDSRMNIKNWFSGCIDIAIGNCSLIPEICFTFPQMCLFSFVGRFCNSMILTVLAYHHGTLAFEFNGEKFIVNWSWSSRHGCKPEWVIVVNVVGNRRVVVGKVWDIYARGLTRLSQRQSWFSRVIKSDKGNA